MAALSVSSLPIGDVKLVRGAEPIHGDIPSRGLAAPGEAESSDRPLPGRLAERHLLPRARPRTAGLEQEQGRRPRPAHLLPVPRLLRLETQPVR